MEADITEIKLHRSDLTSMGFDIPYKDSLGPWFGWQSFDRRIWTAVKYVPTV